ncbi:MAG: anion permease [Candidatus Acidiferrales bacterium]
MWSLKNALLFSLVVVGVWFIAAWLRLARKESAAPAPEKPHTLYHSFTGFIACFFDTLGIGNFAPTTSAFKFRGSVADEKIPGTLNVGYALPTVIQALIYISIVEVDIWTLVLLIVASVLGAWLGAGIVSRWSRRNVQIGMGFALLAAAGLMLRTQLHPNLAAGNTLELRGLLLAVGLIGNFALGALMSLGIGLYAPCLIMISLLGMDPHAAFPIMMGSCAFLMPIGGIRFVRKGAYDRPAAVIMTFAGIPAVLIAAYIVRSLDLYYVRWLVVVVVVFAATMMLRSATRERQSIPAAESTSQSL